ncbi:MAG: DUF898 family protein [Devosia sp.]
MTIDSVQLAPGRAAFTGSRWELAGLILRGYLLMVPTIGLARFWQATWKRRFYWEHTFIGGDPLEYTGHASQLLLGFLFAIACFLPVYLVFFYLSTQLDQIALAGYAAVLAVLWFFAGYAQYRGRDFRFSRTLWRGIRFDVKGNAWAYAGRRFLWTIPMVLTLGLIYPFMAANLWRYRYGHTWFGDRQFAISGTWRQLAFPYWSSWLLNVAMVAGIAAYAVLNKDFVIYEGRTLPGPMTLLLTLGALATFVFSIAFYRARAASRMLSTVSIGDALLKVTIRARHLFGQYLLYAFAFVGLFALFAFLAIVIAGTIIAAAAGAGDAPDPAAVMRFFESGTLNVVLLIVVYLLLLGAFGLLSEIILAVGWWKLVARGTVISNADSLRTVRAGREDRALLGEGLADALNVGAY